MQKRKALRIAFSIHQGTGPKDRQRLALPEVRPYLTLSSIWTTIWKRNFQAPRLIGLFIRKLRPC